MATRSRWTTIGVGALLAALCFGAPCLVRADLKAALAEKDLERRSKLALDNAAAALQAAKSAYQAGDVDKARSACAEVRESAELAYQSLNDTHKNPRKSPRYFKMAELATRDLLRRLETFDHDMSYEDRPFLKPVHDRVQQIHDDLLVGLMEGKPK